MRFSFGCGVGSLLVLDGGLYQNDMLLNVSEDTQLGSTNVCVVVTGNSTAVAITWPAQPAFGQLVTVVDGDGHALTYPITVDGNGHLINGEATLLLQVNRMAATMVYNGTKLVVI
jgi:hypothetical protein